MGLYMVKSTKTEYIFLQMHYLNSCFQNIMLNVCVIIFYVYKKSTEKSPLFILNSMGRIIITTFLRLFSCSFYVYVLSKSTSHLNNGKYCGNCGPLLKLLNICNLSRQIYITQVTLLLIFIITI